MFGDPIGGLNGSERGSFVPLLGDGAAAFVANAAVIRRERLAYYESALGGVRRKTAGGNNLTDAVRRVPFELNGGATAFVFEEVEAQRVGTTADEADGAGEFPKLAAGHPALDQLEIHVIDPKPDTVFAGDDELVVAGFLREHRTAPAH